jgi:hypothetical protein
MPTQNLIESAQEVFDEFVQYHMVFMQSLKVDDSSRHSFMPFLAIQRRKVDAFRKIMLKLGDDEPSYVTEAIAAFDSLMAVAMPGGDDGERVETANLKAAAAVMDLISTAIAHWRLTSNKWVFELA